MKLRPFEGGRYDYNALEAPFLMENAADPDGFLTCMLHGVHACHNFKWVFTTPDAELLLPFLSFPNVCNLPVKEETPWRREFFFQEK